MEGLQSPPSPPSALHDSVAAFVYRRQESTWSRSWKRRDSTGPPGSSPAQRASSSSSGNSGNSTLTPRQGAHQPLVQPKLLLLLPPMAPSHQPLERRLLLPPPMGPAAATAVALMRRAPPRDERAPGSRRTRRRGSRGSLAAQRPPAAARRKWPPLPPRSFSPPSQALIIIMVTRLQPGPCLRGGQRRGRLLLRGRVQLWRGAAPRLAPLPPWSCPPRGSCRLRWMVAGYHCCAAQ